MSQKVHTFHRALHGHECHRYQTADRERRNKLTYEQPEAPLEGHSVHLPVALHEVDGERHHDAACHCRERAEIENAEQHSRHVERRRKQPADEQAPRVACRLEDGARRRKDNLYAHRKRQYPEYGYGRQPLTAEDNQRHFFRCKEKKHAQRQSDKGEEADDTFVGSSQLFFIIL